MDSIMAPIDDVQIAREAGGPQLVQQHLTHAAGALVAADDGDGARTKQSIEGMLVHAA